MVRKIVLSILTPFLLLTAAGVATAQSNGGNFGLGIIVGEPTGIDAKIFLTKKNALEFAVAWSLNDDNDLHIQGDYLWHNYRLIKLDSSDEMPLFFGVGLRAIMRDDRDDRNDRDDVVGIRFPVGLAYMFANYPFDIFAQIAPILDVAPDSDFDLEGAIGARFWF